MINREEYLRLAGKYENNSEVKQLVIFTYEGTKIAYLYKGFLMGVTVGLFAAALISGLVLAFTN